MAMTDEGRANTESETAVDRSDEALIAARQPVPPRYNLRPAGYAHIAGFQAAGTWRNAAASPANKSSARLSARRPTTVPKLLPSGTLLSSRFLCVCVVRSCVGLCGPRQGRARFLTIPGTM